MKEKPDLFHKNNGQVLMRMEKEKRKWLEQIGRLWFGL